MKERDLVLAGIVAAREFGVHSDVKIHVVPVERCISGYRVFDMEAGVDDLVSPRKWTDGHTVLYLGYSQAANVLVIGEGQEGQA